MIGIKKTKTKKQTKNTEKAENQSKIDSIFNQHLSGLLQQGWGREIANNTIQLRWMIAALKVDIDNST